jgi:hypothetical protein
MNGERAKHDTRRKHEVKEYGAQLQLIYQRRRIFRKLLSEKGLSMFTSEQYRAKAAEYAALAKATNSPIEVRQYQQLEQSYAILADNERWLADNYDKTLHASERRE